MFARISILAAVASMASATKLSAESAAEARVDASMAAALDTDAAMAAALSAECTHYYTLAECSWDFAPKMNFLVFGECWDGC